MSEFWSQAEEALRDTLVKKAEGDAFDRMATHHQFPWVKAISEGAWRGALAGMVYDARDTFPVFFATLTKALSDFIENFTDCKFVPAFPSGLLRESGWPTEYVNRYIRIGSTIYYSTGVIPGDILLLSPYTTSYWTKADFVVTEPVEIPLVEVLPFLVWEPSVGPTYPGWNEQTYSGGVNNTVQVEVWPHLAFFPETYLQEPTEYLTADPGVCPIDGGDVCTPESMPNGGYLLETDIEDLEEDYTVAYPVYLGDGDVAPSLRAQFDRLLIAGNWLDMYATSRAWANPVPFSIYYESPEGADNFSEATTNLAARVVFAGAAVPVCTIIAWVANSSAVSISIGDASDNQPSLTLTSAGETISYVTDDAGTTSAESSAIAYPTTTFPDRWVQMVSVCDGAAVTAYADGVSDGSGPQSITGTYVAADDVVISVTGKFRNILIFARALSALEVKALFNAKEKHDVRTPATGWPGEVPAILWAGPAVDGAVPNLGYAGVCGLALNGMVACRED